MPPEASTQEGFSEAVEKIVCAFNFIATYDSKAMAMAYNIKEYELESDVFSTGKLLAMAQEIRYWLKQNPDMCRPGLVMELSAQPVDPKQDTRH